MAEITQFLDKTGLQTFWGIIKENFATKASSVKHESLAFTKNATGAALGYSNVAGTTKSVSLPVADNSNAGIITSETYKKIQSMSGDIQNAVKVDGLKLDGKEVKLVDKFANIKLDYVSDATNAYIRLVDTNDTDVYSEIDVTSFIKTGLLKSAKLVVNPTGQNAGTYIHLIFVTENAGEDNVFINVTDLIDYYTAGEGINITADSGTGADGNRSDRTISLKAATSSALGGIKIGFTETGKKYAVKLDSNKAYVEVPWYKAIAGAGNAYIVCTDNDTDKTTTVTLSADAVQALNNANSALQSVSILGVTLNKSNNALSKDKIKTELGLKGAAYAEIEDTFDSTTAAGTVADAAAIKSYVGTEIGKVTGANGYQQAITNAINALDSNIEAGTTTSNGKTGVKQFFTKIAIVDGKLDSNTSTKALITLNDISDLSVLSDADITAICTFD